MSEAINTVLALIALCLVATAGVLEIVKPRISFNSFDNSQDVVNEMNSYSQCDMDSLKDFEQSYFDQLLRQTLECNTATVVTALGNSLTPCDYYVNQNSGCMIEKDTGRQCGHC